MEELKDQQIKELTLNTNKLILKDEIIETLQSQNQNYLTRIRVHV